MNLFVGNLFSNPVYFFSVILIVGFSVCVHEYCHARVALALGDPTAARQGHLTLNPLKQMGLWSVIMLLILGICWGSVPVDPALVTPRRRAWIALAGPAANFGLFLLALAGSVICIAGGFEFGAGFFLYAGIMNLVLCFLNLVPVPGFDGGAVLLAFLPMERLRDSEVVKGIMVGAMILLFTCIDSLYQAAAWVMTHCLGMIMSWLE